MKLFYILVYKFIHFEYKYEYNIIYIYTTIAFFYEQTLHIQFTVYLYIFWTHTTNSLLFLFNRSTTV